MPLWIAISVAFIAGCVFGMVVDFVLLEERK